MPASTSLNRSEVDEVVHAIKRAVQRARYMPLETIAPLGDDPVISLPAAAS